MTFYEGLAIVIALISIGLTIYRWVSDRLFEKAEGRRQFFQKLIDGFFSHNWKFIEYWENKGIRPSMETTKDVEKDYEQFGRRVVTLDHLHILWQIYLHHKILTNEDVESFRSWGRSWFNNSKDQLKIIFEDGDLFPLDYIVWIRDEVFKKGEFESLMGRGLIDRIQQYEKQKKKR
jgi:hypothetical protein